MTYLLSLAGRALLTSSDGELAQAVSQSFCSVLFGSAPVVGSVRWTAEKILLLVLILMGWKPIFVLHMQRNRIRLFTLLCEKEFFYPHSTDLSICFLIEFQ